jgi:NNP family nitrate/nitrite transporter-like MFS transporter
MGFVVTPFLAEILCRFFSWRGTLAAIGICSVLAGAAFARLARGGDFYGEFPKLSGFAALAKDRNLWLLLAFFSAAIGGSLGVYTMLPLYLVKVRGMDVDPANTIVGISRAACLASAMLSGWVSDRIGTGKTMAGALLLTGLATICLGLFHGAFFMPAVFIQPVLAVSFFPAGFAALSMIGPAGQRNMAVSLVIPASFLIGGGAIPSGIGRMGESGLFGQAIALLGVLLLLCAVPALFVRPQKATAP